MFRYKHVVYHHCFFKQFAASRKISNKIQTHNDCVCCASLCLGFIPYKRALWSTTAIDRREILSSWHKRVTQRSVQCTKSARPKIRWNKYLQTHTYYHVQYVYNIIWIIYNITVASTFTEANKLHDKTFVEFLKLFNVYLTICYTYNIAGYTAITRAQGMNDIVLLWHYRYFSHQPTE